MGLIELKKTEYGFITTNIYFIVDQSDQPKPTFFNASADTPYILSRIIVISRFLTAHETQSFPLTDKRLILPILRINIQITDGVALSRILNARSQAETPTHRQADK